MIWTTLGNALLIFALRVTDVSMGTVRTTMIMRGQRKWAALIGFVEVTIWVLAIGKVITSIDSFLNVIGYSGGFATGTLLGMWLEDRIALGYSQLTIISMKKGADIVKHLHQAGYGATKLNAEGKSGPVTVISVLVPRKELAAVIRRVNEKDATAFVTVEEARKVLRGFRNLRK